MNRSKFQLKYYKMLRAGCGLEVTRVNYTDLISWHRELSDDFFKLFPFIHIVGVTGKVDRDRLESFLKNVKELHDLYLMDTSLGQAWMDNLPNICSQLYSLTVKESPNSVTRFDFILQFARLFSLQTNQQIEKPLHLAERMFQKSHRFNWLWFRGGFLGEIIEISKAQDSSFELASYLHENTDEIAFTDDEDELRREEVYTIGKEMSYRQDELTWLKLKSIYEKRVKGGLDQSDEEMSE